MRKLFTKILISAVMVAIFLAPISPSFEKNSDGNFAIAPKENKALAAACDTSSGTSCFGLPIIQVSNTNAKLTFPVLNITNALATMPTITVELSPTTDVNHITTNKMVTSVQKFTAPTIENIPVAFGAGHGNTPDVNLLPNTQYLVTVTLHTTLFASDDVKNNTITFTTLPADTTTSAISAETTNFNGNGTENSDFGCSPVNPLTFFKQCIVGAVFYLVWTPVSWIAKAAAAILDFFIFYSTNSASYSASFIGSAWATVRDIANIFFILALLYVAIQTILNLGHGAYKMIGTIVIVALLINFSLFFTQVIIDSSNILAKVFYNHIDAKGSNGEIVGPSEQKSITVNLVSAFNPQTMIGPHMSAQPGQTFLMILVSTALMIFMIIIFLSVAFLFVGRVAGLWIAMIFAPIAFASYTLPFDIPGLGHKEWWSTLLKQAFMAPVFIFFLYIILLFGKSFTLIASDYKSSDGMLAGVMTVVIPFMLIFILLKQAKELAVKYSGEMGAAFTKVGGFAMGAVGGLAAFGLTAGVGSAAAKIAGNLGLQAAAEKKGMAGFGARMALRTADYGSKATFDIRKSKVGGMLAAQGIDLKSGTGALGLGESVTTGGYKGVVAKKQEKIEKEKDLFKTHMSDDQVKEWSKGKANEYDKKKTEEKNRLKDNFNNDLFEEANGKRPEFTSAKQLNEARIKTFKDNIGKTGLVYSVAASLTPKANEQDLKKAQEEYDSKKPTTQDLEKAQKEYNSKDAEYKAKNEPPTLKSLGDAYAKKNKPPTFASLNEENIQKNKNIVGAAAVIATGGLGYLDNITTEAAEKGAIKSTEKLIKKEGETEKEKEGLKERKKKIEDIVTKIKEGAGIKEGDKDADKTLENYVDEQLATIDNDLESAKAEQAIHRNNRIIKQNERASIETNPRYKPEERKDALANIDREIKDYKAKEDVASGVAIAKIKEKRDYTIAKNSPNDLLTINTRMETLEGKSDHSKPSSKDKGIPGADTGGGHKEEKSHDAHAAEGHPPKH